MSVDFDSLNGDALVAALHAQFGSTLESAQLGQGSVEMMRPPNSDALITEADYVRDERLPYWADLWPSAHVLAQRILREDGRGHRLLELGSGLGFATVAAMRAGFDVTATDYYTDALHFTRANAWRITAREPVARMVDWRDYPADLTGFDMIIASDVLYERSYADLVAEAIARSLAPGGRAIIADPFRLATPNFLRRAAELGLVATAPAIVSFDTGTAVQRIALHELAWSEAATTAGQPDAVG